MDIKQKTEMIAEDEVNFLDYWKVLVKWKRIFFGIFLVPIIISIIIALIIPRYYRGECEINIPALPDSNVDPALITTPAITASDVVKSIGHIDDIKKVRIFAKNSGSIKSVSISIIPIPNKSSDKISVIIDATTIDIISQAFKDISNYMSNIPEIKDKIYKINTETDFKIQKLTEARKANLMFLNEITNRLMKKNTQFYINPADLITKDLNLSLEIENLKQTKSSANLKLIVGISKSPSITRQPPNAQIKNIIIIICILSFMTSILVVFFLDYIERMKAQEKIKGHRQ